MRVVFDTNVAANASFWNGKPVDCLSAWTKTETGDPDGELILNCYE